MCVCVSNIFIHLSIGKGAGVPIPSKITWSSRRILFRSCESLSDLVERGTPLKTNRAGRKISDALDEIVFTTGTRPRPHVNLADLGAGRNPVLDREKLQVPRLVLSAQEHSFRHDAAHLARGKCLKQEPPSFRASPRRNTTWRCRRARCGSSRRLRRGWILIACRTFPPSRTRAPWLRRASPSKSPSMPISGAGSSLFFGFRLSQAPAWRPALFLGVDFGELLFHVQPREQRLALLDSGAGFELSERLYALPRLARGVGDAQLLEYLPRRLGAWSARCTPRSRARTRRGCKERS